MLGSRQRKIYNDLKNTTVLLTSQYFADKYKISLRTVKNDIVRIDEYLKDRDAKFIRVPGFGMRIVADNNQDYFDNKIISKDFVYCSDSMREKLIILALMFQEKPLTSEQLTVMFDISRGTILTTIKGINRKLNYEEISIYGIKNKGYFLKCSKKGFLDLINFVILNEPALYKNTVFDIENGFLTKNDIDNANALFEVIVNNLLIFVKDYNSLLFSLVFLIKNFDFFVDGSQYKSENSQYNKIINYIEYGYGIKVNKTISDIIINFIIAYTDFDGEATNDTIQDIDSIVEEFITELMFYYPSLTQEKEILYFDLLKHIKGSNNYAKNNIDNKNLLLEQIKNRFSSIFENVAKCADVLKKISNYIINEDEIGYLTLYVCKAIERSEKNNEAKAMIVCNTGVGASSFLANRIIINCPEIHIISINSYFDAKQSELLNSVDMIISTIPIDDIDIPVCVVSPLLNEKELFKIREFAWRKKGKKIIDVQNIFGGTFESKTSIEHIMRTSVYHEEVNEIQAALIAFAVLEVLTLFNEIYPAGLTEQQNQYLNGCIIHVIMAVPRWQRKEYLASDELIQQQYPELYEKATRTIKRIEDSTSIEIKETEAESIVRYLIIEE